LTCCHHILLALLTLRRPPTPPLFPYTTLFRSADFRIPAARFAQRNVSILLDTHILREQPRVEVSPFEARLPLRSPSAVSLLAKLDRKSTRLNSSHGSISYAVFCLKKKNNSHMP